jgi:two-component system CheB/CheR fusion protein
LLRRQVSGPAADGARHESVELDATNRRGRLVHVRVTVSSFSPGAERHGAIVLMDPVDGQPAG